MCITYILRHICGHEHARHVVKCLRAIKNQLDLADIDLDDPSHAVERWECLHEAERPKEYIKPGICEQCKKTGLIADFFERDSAVEYQIIKQWQAHKRMREAELREVDHVGDKDTAEELEFLPMSTTSSITSSGPKTPVSEPKISDTRVMDLEGDAPEATPELFSPISCDFIVHPNSSKISTNQKEPHVVQRKAWSSFGSEENSIKVHELRCRAKMLDTKLQGLLPSANEQISLKRKAEIDAKGMVVLG